MRRAGWAALGLTAGAAAIVATIFVGWPLVLLRPFTDDPAVLAAGVTILLLCAVFQPFDGIQSVATGALRGLGDTQTPMWTNLIGHWGIGLPVAYALCFTRGWGVVGLWTGLALSLVLIGATLLGVWHWRSTQYVKSTAQG